MTARNIQTLDSQASTGPEERESMQVEKNRLANRYAAFLGSAVYEEIPPFPRIALIEISNVCNHSCAFCAYSKMTRSHKIMGPDLFKRVMREAYELGTREVGLHSGAEPFTSKHLPDFVKICSDIGFDYIYLTSNGSLATPKKMKAVIDAGLNSLKFSINAGDRETYKKIHGRDHFNRVLEHLRFVSEYRKQLDRPFFLAASFVEVPENAASFENMEKTVGPLVDEIHHIPAGNQSGQMPDLPATMTSEDICVVPFKQLNISTEGFMRACCNDYQNMLVLEDLRDLSLKEAWEGQTFRQLRADHLRGKLKGTLCHDCMHGCKTQIKPLRPDLADWEAI